MPLNPRNPSSLGPQTRFTISPVPHANHPMVTSGGMVNKQWFMFFQGLQSLTGANSQTTTTAPPTLPTVANGTAITYTGNQTGTVTRTAVSKWGDFVSVKDFGALGNGAHDDTAAIQAAVSSGASWIYFPPGTYILSSTVTLTLDTSLWGDKINSVIECTTASIAMFSLVESVETRANIRFQGLTLLSYVASVTGILLTLCDNTEFQDLIFSGLATNFAIDRGFFHTVKTCLSVGNGTNKAGNFIIWSSDDTNYVGMIDLDGYQIDNIGTGTQQSLMYFRRVIQLQARGLICNDAFSGNGGTGSAILILENDCQGCKFSDSIIGYGNVGITVQQGSGVAVVPTFCNFQNFDVDGCHSFSLNVSAGSFLSFRNCNFTASGNNLTGAAVSLASCSNVDFNGNGIAGFSGANGICMNMTSVTNSNIIGNRLNGSTNGFGFISGDTGLTVKDNILTSITNPISGGSVYAASSNIIVDNPGLNPLTVSTPAMPASTTPVTNSTGARVRVIISGGTFTVVTINGAAAGVAGNNFSSVLNPGETIAITYTVVPSGWTWIGF